jgi:hypothetical protein
VAGDLMRRHVRKFSDLEVKVKGASAL